MTKKDVNYLSHKIIGAATEVHKTLGPDLLQVLKVFIFYSVNLFKEGQKTFVNNLFKNYLMNKIQ
jgi:hypothetical protein